MKKCFICGEDAKIFTDGAWICRDCYLKTGGEAERNDLSIGDKTPHRGEKHIDLKLGKV